MTNGYSLRPYPCLVSKKHAKNTAVPAARLKLQEQFIFKKMVRVETNTYRIFPKKATALLLSGNQSLLPDLFEQPNAGAVLLLSRPAVKEPALPIL